MRLSMQRRDHGEANGTVTADLSWNYCVVKGVPVVSCRRESKGISENQELLHIRFSRCRSSLFKLAVRLLQDDGDAQRAVHNCRVSALRGSPDFKSEGAFRSWLFRILIAEAALLLNGRKANSAVCDSSGTVE